MAKRIEKIKKWQIKGNHISGVTYEKNESGSKRKLYVSGVICHQRGEIVEIGPEGALVPLKTYRLS